MEIIQNTPENKSKIQEKMIEIARQRKTIFYSDLFGSDGPCKPSWLDLDELEQFLAMIKILDDISKKEYQAKRYLLSSVVINTRENMPGKGFYKLGEDLGMAISENSPKEDKKKFWEDRLKETHDEWSKQP